jgi:hypothetical protein
MKFMSPNRILLTGALIAALLLTASCSQSGHTNYYYPADLKGKNLPVWQVTNAIPVTPDQAVLAATGYLRTKYPSIASWDVDSIDLRREFGTAWTYGVTLTDRQSGHYNLEVVRVLMDGSVWKPSEERQKP